ncbi:MAG: SUMF1/EgtB/PvdO family nonheme iron enzyme [Marinicella sp.]
MKNIARLNSENKPMSLSVENSLKKLSIFFMFFVSNISYAEEVESRIALLIGNSDYPNLGHLQNPVNDVNDMSKTLESLGFKTMVGINLNKAEISEKVKTFVETIRSHKNTTSLFYYAGHGLEVDGVNFLIPVQSKLRYQEDLKSEGVSLDKIIRRLKQTESELNIIILDACRDNPLEKRPIDIQNPQQSRSYAKSEVRETAKGMFIAFGTAPGEKAADGIGRNGLFTKHILQNISTPDLPIEDVFNKVRAGVLNESNNKQMTWQNSALVGIGKFYFNPQKSSMGINNNSNNVCYNCPNMISIPSGSFVMGSSDFGLDEKPLRKVNISEFYMSDSEITFKQWNQCVLENYCKHIPNDKGWKNGNYPVVNVSWHDAKQYTEWLTKKTGKIYRLPTEAEWEYAAEVNDINCESIHFGHYDGECGNKKMPAKVKSYSKNHFGLYDMQGNVWEWVEDCKVESHHNAPTDGSARNDGDCSFRILKGASFFEGKNWQRPSVRGWSKSDYRRSNFGFRVVFQG